MKRLRSLSRTSDAVLTRRTAYRSVRQSSTALSRSASSSTSQATRAQPSKQSSLAPKHLTFSRNASSSMPSESLLKTPLYDLHLAHGGKMVPFGGFHMPVQYTSLSVSASHHFTRSHASLFDVSHMVQHRFSGPGSNAFLERITPASIAGLETHRSGLSTLLWPVTGGDCR